ncbi:MAG: DUF6206 family protein [Acidimicrobiia bacterium]|nr:DUF6206 family protein [Acidimicrobiia bacterium]
MNGDLDLAPLEEAVEEALASGGERGLDVLGYGEISFVLGWPGPEGRLACKRLPLFETPEALDAYERCLTLYVERLAERGTTVVASRLVTVSKAGGRIAAYCVQPALPPQAMAPWRLARAEPDEGRGVLGRIVDRIGSTVGDGLGLDGQLSNWAVAGDDVVYFDVTTPMMRDGEGNELLDTDLFLAALPWLLRGSCGGSSCAASSTPSTTRGGWSSTWRATCTRRAWPAGCPPWWRRPTGASAWASPRRRSAGTTCATPGSGPPCNGPGASTAGGSGRCAAAPTRSWCPSASSATPTPDPGRLPGLSVDPEVGHHPRVTTSWPAGTHTVFCSR